MEWLAPLSETGLARALIRSPTLYLFVNAGHILAIAMLFGSILALDLRLLGLSPAVPLSAIAAYLSRLAAIGLAVAVVTGLCLFSVRPLEYAGNPAFLAKLGLVALGIVNAMVVHTMPGWKALQAGAAPTPMLRFAAVLSIFTWMAAVVAGRWIGFL